MQLSKLLLALPLLASTAVAYAINGVSEGVNTQTGERPFRREISAFRSAGAVFDLYIQALQALQDVPQNDMLSWFQVSGLHGYPNIPWDNAPGDKKNGIGYGTHQSVLFPSWHRVYLSLYERQLWEKARDIAAKYPANQRERYVNAAKNFRIPYWDWSMNMTIPDIITHPQIKINAFDGFKPVNNPLYQYAFHPYPSDADFKTMARYPQTVRDPGSDGKSNITRINANLRGSGWIPSSVYQLLSSEGNYRLFSNTQRTPNSNENGASIENTHNAVHSIINGYMYYLPFSSFDPIFILHHANVDRLFAMWQAIYPDSYVSGVKSGAGNFVQPAGTNQDVNTPLWPFHSDAGSKFHTSVSARSTRSFGYSYPEVVDWGVSKQQLSSNVRARVERMYNPQGSKGAKKARDLSDFIPLLGSDVEKAHAAKWQWAVNVEMDRSKISQGLTLYFFFEEPSASVPTSEYGTQSSLVASFPILPMGDCSIARTGADIPITHKLVNNPLVSSLDPSFLTPFLAAGMKMKAVDCEGRVVDSEKLKNGMKVSFRARAVQQTQALDQFPIYKEWKTQGDLLCGIVEALEKVKEGVEDVVEQVKDVISV